MAGRLACRAACVVSALGAAAGLVLAGLPATPTSAAATTISVNGAQRFQRMDGFGVNANPKNWNYSDLTPALDLLTNQLHANLWRVDIYGTTTWIDSPSHLNASYYSVIYESADFQALWNTLAYLNAHGVQIVLTASGLVPTWMGANGGVIDPAQEDNFVEMLTSVVDYGRRVKGLTITMLDPLNETDLGPPEGPSVWQTQYDRIARKLLARLDALGYGDVQLVVAENANVANADSFMPVLLADTQLMARVQHFAFHNYAGTSGNVDGWVQSGSGQNFWMSEWSQMDTDGDLDVGNQVNNEWVFARRMTDDLLSLLGQGAAGALAWDAWDNTSVHHPTWTYWGLLSYSGGGNPPRANGTYTAKKRFYTNAQVFAFVPPGWQRIAASSSDTSLALVAFAGPGAGQVTIVGHNPNASASSLGVMLAGLGTVGSLHWYETNAAENLISRPDIAVANASFAVDVPADSFFTFTTLGAGASPTATSTSTPTPGGTATPTPTATSTPTPPATSSPTAGATATRTPTATATSTPTPGATSTPPAGTSQTLTFDSLSGADLPLSGQYPTGVANWGSGSWYLAAPWGRFTTKSISFDGPARTSATVSLLGGSQRLVQLDAYNGGTSSSTITVACAGQTTRGVAVPADALQTIATGWSSPCAVITIGSSNGWNTNFDNLVLSTAATPTPTPTPTAIRTGTPTPTATRTATAGPRTTVTFDDQVNPDRPLTGPYPAGVINWGTSGWFLSGPYGLFTTSSISFSASGPISASFTLLSPRRVVQVDAYNDGPGSTSVGLACGSLTTPGVQVAARQRLTVTTGWVTACSSTVSLSSTNGWSTNFDNLVLQ